METKNITNFTELWEKVLNDLREKLSESNYNTWIDGSKALWLQDGGKTLVIGVQNEFIKSWVTKKYLSLINESFSSVPTTIKSIKVIVSNKTRTNKQKKVEKKHHNINAELALEEVNQKHNLNKKYTFKEFIVAPYNEYLCVAAQAVVNKLGMAYNPFFIHGSTGVGKTHLLQAIGNKAVLLYPNLKVYYMTSETFINGYYNALQEGRVSDFKTQYRDYQLLIVDDVHFFKDKAKMLEEFFHLFNDLYNKNHQIVFSSDRHPQELEGIEERMVSRFSSGMVLELGTPDKESKEIVLREKARRWGINLEKEVVDYIVNGIGGGIREVEGILKSLMVYRDINGEKPITLQNINTIIKIHPKKSISSKEVINKVCSFYDVSQEEIYGKSRKRNIVFTRQMVMYILREHLDIPYSAIGQKIGGKDHTTAIHSCEKIKKEVEVNSNIRNQVEKLKAILRIC